MVYLAKRLKNGGNLPPYINFNNSFYTVVIMNMTNNVCNEFKHLVQKVSQMFTVDR